MSSGYTVHAHDEDLLLIVACRSATHAKRLLPRVPEDMFQSRSHKRVWRAFRQAHARPDCLWYDPHEVRRQLSAVGGRDEDLELLEDTEESDVAVRQTPSDLVKQLRLNTLRRELWDGSLQQLNTLIGKGNGDADDLFHLLGEMQRAVRPYVGARVAQDAMGDFIRWQDAEHVKLTLGIDVFDERFRLGFMGGDQTTIAGPTSVGKTRLVNWMSDRFASQNHKVGAFCWEVQRPRTIAMHVALRTGEPYERICFDKSDPDFVRRMRDVADQVTSEIEFFSFRDIADRRNKMSRSVQGNIDMIDYVLGMAEDAEVDIAMFDLMANCLPSKRPDDVEAALSHARDWGTRFHHVYIHQLNMKKITGHEDEAVLGDLIGGQAWVSVPDNVFPLRRYKQPDPMCDGNRAMDKDVLEIRCLKQRWGPNNWRVIANFVGERSTLEDWRLPEATDIQSVKETRRRGPARKK